MAIALTMLMCCSAGDLQRFPSRVASRVAEMADFYGISMGISRGFLWFLLGFLWFLWDFYGFYGDFQFLRCDFISTSGGFTIFMGISWKKYEKYMVLSTIHDDVP